MVFEVNIWIKQANKQSEDKTLDTCVLKNLKRRLEWYVQENYNGGLWAAIPWMSTGANWRSIQLCIHGSVLFARLWCHTLVLLSASSLLFSVFRFDTIIVVSALIATIVNSAVTTCKFVSFLLKLQTETAALTLCPNSQLIFS